MSVLIVDDQIRQPTADGRAVKSLAEILRDNNIEILESFSYDDAKSIIISDASLECILLDWSLNEEDLKDHTNSNKLLDLAHSHNPKVPIFIMARRDHVPSMDAETMKKAEELIWILEDTTDFMAGRVIAAINRFWEHIMPPFNKALMQFAQVHEYSWHTPGHTGGTAFLKSPVGREFFNYFGENLLRSDLSVSVGELGSLLDHSGPIGESEKYAACVFGADRSYSVTNGTSASNRIVSMASITRGDHVLVDRNCHKSIEQALIMTGAIPTYMKTSRNRLGLIGPIYPEDIGKEAVSPWTAAHNLTVEPEANDKMESSAAGDSAVPRQKRPVHAIITNSTYDGLCYNVKRVLDILGESIERIHFDEAWYGYARFNPLYKERYGMFEEVRRKKAPTIFTTTSTHKLLAALSQASFIHVRDGSKTIPHERFNESFMMHASTSPQYAIIASNEISAAMMDIGGENLTTESIREAVAFRQALRSINKDEVKKGNWFFDVWNADKIKIPDKPRADAIMGESDAKISPVDNIVDFEKADEEFLVKNASAWVLHPGDKWHGFDKLEDGYCMLDPIKVSIITPGIKPDGSLQDSGIPAMLVTAYLDNRGIVVEKTTDFTILFLFSMGITRGKWGTLINALLKFREDYNKNTPLIEVIPDKVDLDPDHYGSMGLRDLADEMFKDVIKLDLMGLQEKIYAKIPKQDLTPNQSYQKLVHGQAKLLAIDDGDIADRTVATGIIPYPPGIPMLLSGENIGKDGGPHLKYLRALQTWDDKYQGFGHDIHGVVNDEGAFKSYCLNLKR